ncbi:MAG: hypothetical protein R3E02_03970 [Blastomonas sp.]
MKPAPLAALMLIAPFLAMTGPAAQADQNAAAPAPVPHVHGDGLPDPVEKTRVVDPAMMAKLFSNSGTTLQWIGWDRRGKLSAEWRGDAVHISGRQAEPGDTGLLRIEGDVIAMGKQGFTFRGTILIADTPDYGRFCLRSGDMEFLITRNRKYWRLQEMTECDGLTDYVDIYF